MKLLRKRVVASIRTSEIKAKEIGIQKRPLHLMNNLITYLEFVSFLRPYALSVRIFGLLSVRIFRFICARETNIGTDQALE